MEKEKEKKKRIHAEHVTRKMLKTFSEEHDGDVDILRVVCYLIICFMKLGKFNRDEFLEHIKQNVIKWKDFIKPVMKNKIMKNE